MDTIAPRPADRERQVTTVVDVARRAGVSAATVSRVLAGRNVVAAATRERVLEAVRALQFQPNAFAQGLRSGRGQAVALLVSDIEQTVYSALTKHVQAALEEIGLDLLLFNLGHRQDRLRGLLERATALRLRGIVIASNDVIPMRELKPLVSALQRQGVSILSIGQRLDRYGIPSVVHEETAAAARAAQYLLDTGRAPIAYLSRIRNSATGQERYRGYLAALKGAGIDVDPALVWDCSYRYAAGYEAMSRALDRRLAFRSLLAASDELALGAMAAALDRGLKVPDDVAIIGFGGIAWGEHVRPALTTLGADPKAIGEHVRDMFRNLLDGGDVPRQTVVKRPLLLRQSA
ncbi:MAG: LacI family transcriptional regulator [Alphaproteobacteria bacterium]|nr:LacI family transcriptional regulator [Alphaproteobacteria bacterium]